MLKNDRLLRAMRHQPVDMTPIWIMRQAGRYLPEYRATRAKAGSFLTLCKTPELACEVTLQPLKRFPLDAAILFSDILTIPDAMGLGLYFREGEGPIFTHPLTREKDIKNLSLPDPEQDLGYVLSAIRLIRQALAGQVPLIGFCGSPWTLACYMVEGKANKSFPKVQALRAESPQLLHQLLDKLAQAVSLHLNAQIQAGAEVVMLFDTWGGLLDTPDYQAFSLHYLQQIISNLQHANIPIVLFTKNGGQWLDLIIQTGCHVVGLDWTTDLREARKQANGRVALQGNLDPSILKQSEDLIYQEVQRILESYGTGSGHVFNLGHGITPDIDPGRVAFLVETVHSLSRPYHARKSEST